MANEQVTVGAVSMRVVHDKEQNLAKYLDFIDRAAAQGVRLLVFPEQSLQGYLYNLDHGFTREEMDYHYANAETVPGESTEALMERARAKDMYIIFGMTEKMEAGFVPFLFNTAVLVGPQGLLGSYRKVHLPGDERHVFGRGDDWPVFDTDLGRVGMLICWDQLFPESTRELTLQGAEVLVMATAWPQRFSYGYDLMTRARAAENHRWYISSNQVGRCDKGEQVYYGHSRIVDPRGRIIAETGDDEEGMALATIDVKEGIRRQQSNIFYTLQWRVPSSYRRLADEGLYPPRACG